MEMFRSPLLLSSKHHKEVLLQPLFEPYGVQLIIPDGFDTDAFGTFCGAIPRAEGPKHTVKEKCLAGMAHANRNQGLASEGSFGAHPSFPFLTINEEWLVFIDLKQDLEIYGHSTTLEVCYAQLGYQEKEQLQSFLDNCSFGSQALVFKDRKSGELIKKGIQDLASLKQLMKKHPEWQLETDLRAHLNPLRQKNIIAAGRDLLKRMESRCPKCKKPDFSVTQYSGKLLCSWCQKPTDSYAFLESNCAYCNYQIIEKRMDKEVEEPQYCNHCNP